MVADPLFILIVGSIVLFLCLGIVGNWQYAFRIQQLKRALDQFSTRESEWELGSPHEEVIRDIITEYREQRLAGIEHLNTQALIEGHFESETVRVLGIFPISIGGWERFNTFLGASMVMLGLLGTFIGLTSALFGMQDVLIGFGRTGEEVAVSQIVSAISQPFEGMSFAFITSIYGIGSSLLLTAFSSGLFGRIGPNTEALKAEFMTKCEHFLDNHFVAFIETLKPRGSMDELMERLANNLKKSFDESIATFATSIMTMTAYIQESVTGINQMVEKQSTIITALDQGSSKLLTFGREMDKTVNQLVKNHQDTASQMDQLGMQVQNLHQAIEVLGDKTADSSRSLENIMESTTRSLNEERQNNERMVQLLQGFHKQVEDSGKQLSTWVQQANQEVHQRTKEQWDQLRREWQAQKEHDLRKEQEQQQQLLRHIEQVFQRLEQSYQEKNRGYTQNIQQTYEELSHLIRQQEELGQRTIESHRFLIERLPNLTRSSEEFSRSIENLERLFHEFLERMRREISTMMSQNNERERNFAQPQDSIREIRELVREIESVRIILEREFNQTHRFSYEIQQLVEAIYQTGRNTVRQPIESRAIIESRDGREFRDPREARDTRDSYQNVRYRDGGVR